MEGKVERNQDTYDCDIIRDLLPSYVDGICSGASKKLVEGHLASCKACRELTDLMQENELVHEPAACKEVDYMKKVKRHITGRNLFVSGFLVAFSMVGLAFIGYNYYMAIPVWFYYVLLPAVLSGTAFVLTDYIMPEKPKKGTFVMAAAGGLLLFYVTALAFLVTVWVERESYPFGLPGEKMGPVLGGQLFAAAVFELALFVAAGAYCVKTEKFQGFVMVLSMTGGCMALAFLAILRRLDSVETFAEVRNEMVLVLFAEGIAMAVILWIWERKIKV